MSIVKVKNEISLEDVMLAADTVDTIRHEWAIQETELMSDDRRSALKAKLRDLYKNQGIEVSDEILDQAVDNENKNRYVHQPFAPGMDRFYARLWINRKAITKRTAYTAGALALLLTTTSVLHHYAIVQPRERAAVALAEQTARDAAELKLELETKLPTALKTAHTNAVAAANKYNDTVSVSHADNLRDETEAFIASSHVVEARNNIKTLNDLTTTLEAKASIADLNKEYEAKKTEILKLDMDTEARKVLAPLLVTLETTANKGNKQDFASAMSTLDNKLYAIMTPLDVRVVDQSGVLSGVWRSQDGGRSKVHYLIVEAVNSNGLSVPMEIKSFETGKSETVPYWGLRVSENKYNSVGKDKKDNGVIDNNEIGVKPSGTLNFDWADSSYGPQLITKW